MAIVKRTTKGSALTHAELDGNFTDLDGRVTTIESGSSSQTLTFVNPNLSISGGNTVDLSSLSGGGGGGGIALTDLSVSQVSSSGTGSLAYSNTTGVFTYTPPDLSNFLTSVSQSDVTAHQAALSITQSQITDLNHYTNSDVDAHINQSTATANQVLSWNGSDYAWVANGGGSSYDQSLNTTDSVTFAGITSTSGNVFSGGTTTISSNSANTWPNHTAPFAVQNTGSTTTAFQMNVTGGNDIVIANNNGSFVVRNYGNSTDIITVSSTGTVTATAFVGDGSGLTGIGASYGDSDVDAHLNQTNPTSGYVLSWNGSDYAWVVNGTGTGLGDVVDDTTPQLGGNLDLNGNDIIGTGNIAISGFLGVGTAVQFEGSTSDAFETTLTVTDPTADRTITLPDDAGTVMLVNNLSVQTVTAVGSGSLTYSANGAVGVLEFSPPNLSSYATQSYVTSQGYATQSYVNSQGFITNSALSGYATESFVTGQGYATQSFVLGQGFLTNADLTNYVTNSSLSSTLSSYASMAFISSQNFLNASGVDSHLNQSSASANQVLSWDGADYAWVAQSGGGNTFDSSIIFEGATADDFETTLTVTDPTADRTITLPDASGTVALTSDLGSLQNLTTTQRDALTPSDGDIIYNTSNSQFELYTNTSWAAMTKVVYGNLLPSSDFVDQITNIWSANPTTPADFATWAQTIASDGYEYGNIDLSTTPPTIRSADSLQWLNISTNNSPDPAQVTRWYDIVLPSLIEQSWFDVHTSNLVTGNVFSRVSDDTTPKLGGALDADGKNIENLGQVQIGQLGAVVFEGFTDDAFETTLTVTDPTADRTITLPDATGTVALTSDIPTAYTDSDVDTHLNTSGAASGQILSWNGSDYAWVTDQTGAGGGGVLTFTGHEPTVTYDVTGNGSLSSGDALAYGRFGGSVSAQTASGVLASDSIIPPWSAQTGTIYTNNRFQLNLVEGNGRDALLASLSTQAEGMGDTFVLGNVNDTGTDILLVSGLGVEGGSTHLVARGDQSTITIINHESNGSIRLEVDPAAGSAELQLSNTTISSTGIFNHTGALNVTGVTTVTSLIVNDGTAAMVFEGDTADNSETTVTFEDPTVDRTITFPNASGNVALNSVDAQTGQFLSWTHIFNNGSMQTVTTDNSSLNNHSNIFIQGMVGGDEMTVVITQSGGAAAGHAFQDGDRSNVAITVDGTVATADGSKTIVKFIDTGSEKLGWVVATY